ncbi:GNAT family N-acetyltransferase [Roseovarius phycicola]|uniref:GNAT family N-acetyltransferase n=1 Tax=Roseovarius phycicola TaxID=3080976 RepID=A0ABZ2HKC7_9RHOB
MKDLMTQMMPEDARIEDAPALAQLVVMAGHGMPLLVWEEMREPGEDVWDVGARRAAREEGQFSYRKARVIRRDGTVISSLVGYPLDEVVPEAELDDLPPLFRPLVELENEAVPSWYVNVLATFPEARCKGAAKALLQDAEAQARASGQTRMSIITSDDNPALKLYEHVGYRQITRRPVVRDGWKTDSKEWILLIKNLG